MNENQSHDELNNGIDQLSQDAKTYLPIEFYGISITKLIFLYTFSIGFYTYYWLYKNWKAIQQNDPSRNTISPFFRSILGIFFFHSLCTHIKGSMKNYSTKSLFSANWLSRWYIIYFVLLSLEKLLYRIGIVALFLRLFILIRLQEIIILNNTKINPNYQYKKRFSFIEYIFMIPGVVMLGNVILRFLKERFFL